MPYNLKGDMLNAAIDYPEKGTLVIKEQIRVGGWVYAAEQHSSIEVVEVSFMGKLIGETKTFFSRPDVNKALRIPIEIPTGFSLLCGSFDSQSVGQKAEIDIKVRFKSGQVVPIQKVQLKFADVDISARHYGSVLNPDATKMMHRDNIYATGPSSPIAAPECVAFVERYLSQTDSILDVGCGIGAYGRELIKRGYNWFGIEVKKSDCDELARLGLPHMLVDGGKLPFTDGQYQNAICIEVLEHIPEYNLFLSELRRVVKQRVIFSVPNVESIPLYHPHHVVPWHLLEGDHKNFFTRFNLKALLSNYFRNVEIQDYGLLPMRTVEGLPVYNHLLAIADC